MGRPVAADDDEQARHAERAAERRGGQRPGMSPGEGRCEAEQQRQPQERATEDSGQPGVGQGIAEQALLGRPADAQGPARGERGEHAR